MRPGTDVETDWLLEIAGQHPFFLQVACSLLFDAKQHQPSGRAIQYEKVQHTIYQILQPHFEEAWQTLSVEEQQQLITEVLQDGQARHSHQEFSTSGLFRRKVRELSQNGRTEKQKNHPPERNKGRFVSKSNRPAFYHTHQKNLRENDTFPLLTNCLAGSYIEKAFEQLPWIERNCLLLYADAEFTQADIAEILGLRERVVSQHLVRAAQLWLQVYNSLLVKNIDIHMRPISVSSAHMTTISPEEDLLRVKRLIQNQNR